VSGRESNGESAAAETRRFGIAAAGLGLVVFALFGRFLFSSDDDIPSHLLGDTANYFIAARSFGLEQLLQGNLPLWNPHTFSGTPFVGVFQSSLLYPLNVIYFVLPLDTAITFEFAISVYLVGLFVLLWLRGQGLAAPGAFFAAVGVMLGATFMLRVLAGQLTVIHTLAWFPALLLCIDRLAQRITLGWILCGIGVVSMMILACHPPSLLMAGFAASVYVGASLFSCPRPIPFIASLLPVALVPPFVTAIQLWPGLQVASQGSRQGAMPYDFATSYSFPPENLITAVVPHFFGAHVVLGGYFGRWFYWDASVYVGVVVLVLAVYGALAARVDFRRSFLVLGGLLFVLSLGRYTPVYQLFYDGMPGFSLMRAPSKFMFYATIFLCGLAGAGVGHLLAADGIATSARRMALGALGLAFGTGALGAWAGHVDPSQSAIQWLAKLEEFPDLRRLPYWHEVIRDGCYRAAGFAAGAALLLWLAPRYRAATWGLVGLGVVELLLFAQANLAGIDLEVQYRPSQNLSEIYDRAGEDRVLEGYRATNVALAKRRFGIWGYDPMTLQRYKEFIALTQGRTLGDLDNVGGLHPNQWHRLLVILRGRMFVTRGGRLIEREETLPRLSIVRSFRFYERPKEILDAMIAPGFDPTREVILETAPNPPPSARVGGREGAADRIELVDESTDHLTLEVELDTPGILLVTDSYDEGWRAVALPGSAQSKYEVLPADYCVRAVALGAGLHRLRLEYAPTAYVAGLWSTSVSTAGLLAATVSWGWRRRTVKGAGA